MWKIETNEGVGQTLLTTNSWEKDEEEEF